MKLPNFNKKEEKKEYFLSIVLKNEKVTAVVFEEIGGNVNAVGQGTETLKTDVETATEQELMEALDKAISVAEGPLPDNITTHKTIFGLKENWIEEGKIKKDYLLKLKKICDELELKPVGFLAISEAVAHLMEKEEGAPISAILADVGNKTVTVSLIKAGKLKETKTSEIHNSVPYTTDTLLKHFQIPEVLPSKIILMGETTEDLSQEFLGFAWSKSLPFLHLPQVKVLPFFFDSKAVLVAAATQMGLALAPSVDKFFNDSKADIKPLEMVESPIVDDEVIGPTTPTEATPKDEIDAEVAGGKEDEFGFLEGKDVAKKSEPKTAVVSDNINLGEEIQEIPDEQLAKADKKQLPINAAFITAGFRKFTTGIKRSGLSFKSVPLLIKSGRGKLLLIPLVLFLLLFLVLYIYLFKTSAVVTLSITPKTQSKEQAGTFSTSKGTSASDNIIGAEGTSISEDGKLSRKATGKKETGDKAKGKVIIVSSLTKEQTIDKGTSLTSSNGLVFTLDGDVKIASSSGVSDIKQASGNVTAKDIGKEYNLPSGTKFSVSGFDKSSIEGKNDDAFSGGTKKEITVVSKEDQDKLAIDIVKSLTQQAKDNLQKKLGTDTLLLPVFLKTSFETKGYSKDVGDEAAEVALTSTVKFQGATYKQSDLYDFAKEKLNSSEDNLTVNPADFKVEVKDAKVKGTDSVSATLDINSSLIPKINKEDLQKKIEGKAPTEAEDILKALPLVDSVEIKISPSIPLLPRRVPSTNRIKILINTNG